jgi:hypothetical protein
MAQPRGEPKRYESFYATAVPERRPLKIYASDPMAGRLQRYRISINIENEPDLQPGPRGDLVEVIDYDGEHRRYYAPVDLNLPAILMQGGLDPNESDPRFHQQMVYAVAMRAIETASRALGRPVTFKTRKYARLRLIPHAFYGANAFFDPKLNAVLFGYFQADETAPGENIPGQNVFTCLSHDIIVHEVMHAIVHRLRRYFLEPSNVDVLAFHEAFSDIVALFQRFSYAEILREHIQSARAHLQDAQMLVDLAQQFGQATGRGRALRSALGRVDPNALGRTFEPHTRGAILVSAVFDGFFRTYERRIADLIRIATAGSGILPEGNLHPDLVNRIAREAVAAADAVLRMCIRAFDYLPPMDVTFGDYLRGLVTADYELEPDDPFDLRHSMIEGFRTRGIIPEDVPSLAEESLILESVDLPRLPRRLLNPLLVAAANVMDRSARRRQRLQRLNVYQSSIIETDETVEDEPESVDEKPLYPQLWKYAEENASALGLDPQKTVAIQGFHPVHRVARDGSILVEFVIQVVQTDRQNTSTYGGLPLRGGATIVAGADGAIRYVISKPMPSNNSAAEVRQAAKRREDRFREFVALCDARDPNVSWADDDVFNTRMLRLQSFRALHGGF